MHDSGPPPLVRLPDGTVKQVSPLTGTVVWTVPGRAHRLLGTPPAQRHLIDHSRDGAHCAFCPDRVRETPPEKSRVVRTPDGGWLTLHGLRESELDATVAEFRRIPNLFEILSVDYWRANHDSRPSDEQLARTCEYVAEPGGRAHVLAILRRRLNAQGVDEEQWAARPPEAWLERAVDLFIGTHDVIVARRHFVEGAEHDDELAGSGTLTPDEHRQYVALTVEAMADLYASQSAARYVAAFQNWLKPAGASFDHLHKQLVAIDEHGPHVDRVLARLREEPDLFDRVLDHAARHGLVIARNEHAVAIAAVGHRYPSVELYSTGPARVPWECEPEQVQGMADLIHAMHAATGVTVACNEEWQHRPPGVDAPIPWHVVLKWRVSTLAGFEGSTKINVNTLDPGAVRHLVVGRLAELRATGRVAPLRIGDECQHPAVRG